MKVYQNSVTGGNESVVAGEHQGYSYFPSKREAQRHATEAKRNDHDVEMRVIDVVISKRGILNALNRYGGHAENG